MKTINDLNKSGNLRFMSILKGGTTSRVDYEFYQPVRTKEDEALLAEWLNKEHSTFTFASGKTGKVVVRWEVYTAWRNRGNHGWGTKEPNTYAVATWAYSDGTVAK